MMVVKISCDCVDSAAFLKDDIGAVVVAVVVGSVVVAVVVVPAWHCIVVMATTTDSTGESAHLSLGTLSRIIIMRRKAGTEQRHHQHNEPAGLRMRNCTRFVHAANYNDDINKPHALRREFIVYPSRQLSHKNAPCCVHAAPRIGVPLRHMHIFTVAVENVTTENVKRAT